MHGFLCIEIQWWLASMARCGSHLLWVLYKKESKRRKWLQLATPSTATPSPPTPHQLYYLCYFSSLLNAMITLFQLFTLDQWYKIYNDLTKVSSVAFTCTYILLWVWIGSFVFRNLFVGIMGEYTRLRAFHIM